MADNSNESVLSTLLSKDENSLVVAILGNRKEIKATAVIQMFHANPNKAFWTKFSTGIVCFVKDNTKRSYYIRLLDLKLKTVTYEQEIYDQFTYKKHSPHFHSFPGDEFMIGMNFADKDEALLFGQAINSISTHRNTIKKRNNDIPQVSDPTNNESDLSSRVLHRNGARRKKKRVKQSKAGISVESDFQQLAYTGINASADINNISADWKQLLDTAGVTHKHLENKDTAEFIYDFVEKHGGIEKANRQLGESKRKALPPLPAKKALSDLPLSSQPPAPPSPQVSSLPPVIKRGNAPPPPLKGGGIRSSLSTSSMAPPAPPPPPPPPLAPLPPLRSLSSKDTKCMASASATKRLSAPPDVSEAHGDFLSSIRAGMQLRAVEERETPANQEADLDGLAGALARALASRNSVMQASDDEEEDEEDGEDEWSD